MTNYQETSLWRRTLGEQVGEDSHKAPRARLREAYIEMRENVAVLAQEIPRDLPGLTVHDISHMDALWENADIILGEAYPLTPAEAFVLGGAILLHDTAMSLPAVGGVKELKAHPAWDTTLNHMAKRRGLYSENFDAQNPPADLQREAIPELLRTLHAEQAENLIDRAWKNPSNGETYHLLANTELRQAFAHTIGKIAHSHWWSIEKVEDCFANNTMGASLDLPQAWTVDTLKIAAILRVADACHLDSRRAPGFLYALRQPEGVSDIHWNFQNHLNQPRVVGDALDFTTMRPFSTAETEAWWLCFDTLNMAERVLSQTDALLADQRDESLRFKVRRIRNAETPSRLVRSVQIEGWEPIDTAIHISDVPDLVEKLGGKALYGNAPTVPLREMIQNAADAIRARAILDDADESDPRYAIHVTLREENGKHILEITDNGMGMSNAVIQNNLLNFGTSYWGSNIMRQEHPKLAEAEFTPTGRYGIGFFSIFMIAERITLTTRPYDQSAERTRVLEFSQGLDQRPVLRHGEQNERLKESGTRIRLELLQAPSTQGGLLNSYEITSTLHDVTRHMAPALDTSLHSTDADGRTETLVGGAWRTVTGHAFFDLLIAENDTYTDFEPFAANIQCITDKHGTVVGRGCIAPRFTGYSTIGGLHGGDLNGFAGVMAGTPSRVIRDNATPLADLSAVQTWAEDQRIRLVSMNLGDVDQCHISGDLIKIGVEPIGLKIVQTGDGSLDAEELVNWAEQRTEIHFADYFFSRSETGKKIEIAPSFIHFPIESYIYKWTSTIEHKKTAYTGTIGYGLCSISRAWGVPFDALHLFYDKIERHIIISGTVDGVAHKASVSTLRRAEVEAFSVQWEKDQNENKNAD